MPIFNKVVTLKKELDKKRRKARRRVVIENKLLKDLEAYLKAERELESDEEREPKRRVARVVEDTPPPSEAPEVEAPPAESDSESPDEDYEEEDDDDESILDSEDDDDDPETEDDDDESDPETEDVDAVWDEHMSPFKVKLGKSPHVVACPPEFDVRAHHACAWLTADRAPSVFMNFEFVPMDAYHNKVHDYDHITYALSTGNDHSEAVLKWIEDQRDVRIYVITRAGSLDLGLFKGRKVPDDKKVVRFIRSG